MCVVGLYVFVGKDCEDIDECDVSVTNKCNPNYGSCVNKETDLDFPLGYTCLCNSGFELSRDGVTCSDINECRLVLVTYNIDV